jgi:hypothetical protein
LSQNNPCFGRILSKHIPSCIKRKIPDISSVFRMKSAGRRYRQCFLLDKSCRKIYTIFSVVLRQQRKSDVMTSLGHSAHSTVYYKAASPLSMRLLQCVHRLFPGHMENGKEMKDTLLTGTIRFHATPRFVGLAHSLNITGHHFVTIVTGIRHFRLVLVGWICCIECCVW